VRRRAERDVAVGPVVAGHGVSGAPRAIQRSFERLQR
jgi:hypothetical protein